MKVIFVFSILFIISTLSLCNCNSINKIENAYSQTTQKSEEVSIPPEIIYQIPKGSKKPVFVEPIDNTIKESNLYDLRSVILKDDNVEIRIWAGFGLFGFEGLIINKNENNQFDSKLLSRTFICRNDRKILPKSGWAEFWKSLQSIGTFKIPEVDKDSGWTDGTSFVVEISQNGIYKTYHFGNPDKLKSKEAKQMIEIGKLISNEFDLPLFQTDYKKIDKYFENCEDKENK